MNAKNDRKNKDGLDQLEEKAREVPEQRESVRRGPDVLREHLRQAAKKKKQLTMRLDRDIVDRFKQLAGADGSYQTLINRALHEWLEAKSVSALLRDELDELDALVRQLKAERRTH